MGARLGWATALLAVGGWSCEDTLIIPQRDWINPQSLDFGARPIDTVHVQRVTLTNRSPADSVVGSVRFDPDVAAFTARTENNQTLTGQPLRAGRQVEVRVNFTPSQVQVYDTTMYISIGGTEVPLPITASGVEASSEITVNPGALEFGSVLIGSRVTRSVVVENTGNRAVSLSEVLLGGNRMPDRMEGALFFVSRPGSQTPVRDLFFAAGQRETLEVHFQPSGEAREERLIELVFAGQARVPVNTAGQGVVPGAFQCQPVFHDFGQKIRGQIDRVSARCTAVDGAVRIANAGFDVGSSRFFGAEGAPPVGRLISAGESVVFFLNFVAQGLPKVHEATYVFTPEGGGTPASIFLRAEVVAPPVADTQVSVTLNWDTPGTDLDLHFVRGDRQPFNMLHDCYFAQKNPDWGVTMDPLDDPFLDRDDTNGYGPEEMNLALSREARYNVFVHFYRAPVGGRPSLAEVSINLFGTLVATPARQLQGCGELWHVGRIDIDGAARTGRFTPVDTVGDLTARAECPP